MIFVKIGKIVHFDDKSTHNKIQNDSDIFDVVMTSSKSSEMTSSAKNDDGITMSKMLESFGIFFCELVLSK